MGLALSGEPLARLWDLGNSQTSVCTGVVVFTASSKMALGQTHVTTPLLRCRIQPAIDADNSAASKPRLDGYHLCPRLCIRMGSEWLFL